MLVWLDSNSNVKGKPNENYARELMELFSLGVGHYTEKDIREAARAFTGWRTDGEGFAFDARLHDGGPKTVLGQTGAWDGGDVVRIVLEQPAAARFLVRKLYRFLVSEKAAPPDSLLEPLCESFRRERLRHRRAGPDHPGLAALLLEPRLPAADQGTGGVRAGGGAGGVSALRRRGSGLPAAAAASAGGPDRRDGSIAVRAAQRQGLAGRLVLAEHLHGAGARQLRRGPGDGHALAPPRRRSRPTG